MKRIIGITVLTALLGVSALAPAAQSQCVTGTGTNLLFKWDANGFSYETGAPVVGYISPAGNVLTDLTGLTLLCAPFGGLDPNDPAKEYTLVMTGLVSGGTAVAAFGLSGHTYTTLYQGGAFAMYEGPVNARGYVTATVPAPALAQPNYTDGVVLLSGTIDSLTTNIIQTSLGTVTGSFRGRYHITGGSYSGGFCNNTGLFDGLMDPVNTPAGYTSQNNGKFDAPSCPTPARRSSWGRIKSIYR